MVREEEKIREEEVQEEREEVELHPKDQVSLFPARVQLTWSTLLSKLYSSLNFAVCCTTDLCHISPAESTHARTLRPQATWSS